MSVEKRDHPRAWHQSPSMSELLASCAAADAVSKPPERPGESERLAAGERPAQDEITSAPPDAPAAEGPARRDAA